MGAGGSELTVGSDEMGEMDEGGVGRNAWRCEIMKKEYIRILPALVVDQVFVRALLVGRVLQAHLEDFGIVEQLLVEAQDFLVLAVHGWRHDCTRNKIGTKKEG
jgi:hypothetical protein